MSGPRFNLAMVRAILIGSGAALIFGSWFVGLGVWAVVMWVHE